MFFFKVYPLVLLIWRSIEAVADGGWEAFSINNQAPDLVKCHTIISELKLQYFQFNYDTKSNRRQLGLLGEEVEQLLPEAVRRIPWKQPGDEGVLIANFALVDSDVVFSHNLAALQVHEKHQTELEKDIETLQSESKDLSLKLIRIAEYRGQEWQTAAQIRVLREAVEKEVEAIEEHLHVINLTENARRSALSNETAQELFLLNLEYDLAVKRAQEKVLLSESLQKELEILKDEFFENDELMRLQSEITILNITATLKKQEMEQEAEIMGKIAFAVAREAAAIERENEDLHLREMRATAEEYRRATQEGLQLFFALVGEATANFLDQPLLIAKCFAMFMGILSLLIITKQGAIFLHQYLVRKLARPALIREAHRSSIFGQLFDWIFSVLFRAEKADSNQLDGIFINSELASRVQQLVKCIRVAQSRGENLRHVLLYGLPGTGKSVLAKRIAQLSGLDFAVMSGGDLGPLGSQAVTELQAVLRWSCSGMNGNRGLLLLIDEAEAALADRNRVTLSEGGMNALNALLYETGEQSSKLMLVLATSRPEDIDEAILDRMDEVLDLPLPEASERKALVEYLYDRVLCAEPPTLWKSLINGSNRFPKISFSTDLDRDKMVSTLVSKTSGFSGREINKVIVSLQAKAFGAEGCKLTSELCNNVIDWKLEEFRSKQEFIKATPNLREHAGILSIQQQKGNADKVLNCQIDLTIKKVLDPEVTSDSYCDEKNCPENLNSGSDDQENKSHS